jgi:Transposase and inactivated derivatives
MPWQEVSLMSQRQEFVRFAQEAGCNRRELCRRFGISPKTGYKWLRREDLADRSRRPRHSPTRTSASCERLIVGLREEHPGWGARKLRKVLRWRGQSVPAASTVHAVLRRHGLIDSAASAAHRPFQRFEHAAPNDFWQADFKGHLDLTAGGRCHPLTTLDDHSRFAIRLEACADERASTVRTRLQGAFERYGCPLAIGFDNGAPWGNAASRPHTELTVWLMRLGIRVIHSRPYHPQTLGKAERFHRTLKAELLGRAPLRTLEEAQRRFDAWRQIYNCERPHEALGLEPPISRYQPSVRRFPATLPPIEYAPGDLVRKVWPGGFFSIGGHRCRAGKPFVDQYIALRPGPIDGCYRIYFCQQQIGELDLRLLED